MPCILIYSYYQREEKFLYSVNRSSRSYERLARSYQNKRRHNTGDSILDIYFLPSRVSVCSNTHSH